MKPIKDSYFSLFYSLIFILSFSILSQNAIAENETETIQSRLYSEFERLKKTAFNIKKKTSDTKKTMGKILDTLDLQVKFFLNQEDDRSLLLIEELTEQLKISTLSILINKEKNIQSCYESTKYILRSLIVILRLISPILKSEKTLPIRLLKKSFLLLHISSSLADSAIKAYAKVENQSVNTISSPISWSIDIPINPDCPSDIWDQIKEIISLGNSKEGPRNNKAKKSIKFLDTICEFDEIYSKHDNAATFYRTLYQAAILIMTIGSANKLKGYTPNIIEADCSTTIRILSSLDCIDSHNDPILKKEIDVLINACGEILSESSNYTPFPLLHIVSIFTAKRLLNKIVQLFSSNTAIPAVFKTIYDGFMVASLEARLERINTHIASVISLYLKSTNDSASEPDETSVAKIIEILQDLLYIYERSTQLISLMEEVNLDEAIEQIATLKLINQPLASFTKPDIFCKDSENSELLLDILQHDLKDFHQSLRSMINKISELNNAALPNLIKKLSTPSRDNGEKILDSSIVKLILEPLKNPKPLSRDYSETLELMLANLVQESITETPPELTKEIDTFTTKEGNSTLRSIEKSFHTVTGFFSKLKQWICSSANYTPMMDIITNGSSLTLANIQAFRDMLKKLQDPWDNKHLSVNSILVPQEPIASPNTETKPEDIKTAQELLVIALRETELQCSSFTGDQKISDFFKTAYSAFIEAQDNPLTIGDRNLLEKQHAITTVSGLLKYMAVSLSNQPCKTCMAMKDNQQRIIDCNDSSCSASKFIRSLNRITEHNNEEFRKNLDNPNYFPLVKNLDIHEQDAELPRLTTVASKFIDNLSSLLITPAMGKNDLHLDMLLYCTFILNSTSESYPELWGKSKKLYLIHKKINGQVFSRAFQEISDKNNPTLRLLHKTASTKDQFIEKLKQTIEISDPSYTAPQSVKFAAKMPKLTQKLLPKSMQNATRVYQRQQQPADQEKTTEEKIAPSIEEENILSGSSQMLSSHSAIDSMKYTSSPSILSEQDEEQKRDNGIPDEIDTLNDSETMDLLSGKDKRIDQMTDEIITKFNQDELYQKKVCKVAVDLFEPFASKSDDLKEAVTTIRKWVTTGVGNIGKKTSTILAVIVSSAVIISNSSSWFDLMKKFANKFINISALTTYLNSHGPNPTLLARSENGNIFQFPETESLLNSSEGIASELHNAQYFQGPDGEELRRTPGATNSGFLTFNVVTTIALGLFNVYGVYKSVQPQQARLSVFDQSEYLPLLAGKIPTAYFAKYLGKKAFISQKMPNCLYKVRDTLENPCNSCGSEASFCSTCIWQTITNCLSIQCFLQTSKTFLPTPCYNYDAISSAARSAILAAAAGIMSKALVFDMLKLVLNARIKDMLTQLLTGVMLNIDYSFSATQKSAMVTNFMTAAEHYQANVAFNNLQNRILNPSNPVPFTETDKQILKQLLTPEAYNHYVIAKDATTPAPYCNPNCRMAACGACLQGTSCICAGATCALFSAIPCLGASCNKVCILPKAALSTAKAAAKKSMQYYSVHQFPNNIVSPSINKAIAEFTQVAKEADKLIQITAGDETQTGITKALTTLLSKGSQSVGQIAQIRAYLKRLGWKQEHKAYLLIALIIGAKDCMTGNFARWSHLQGDDLLRTVADVLDQLDTPVTNLVEGHAREMDNITQPYGLVHMGEHLAKLAMSQQWQSDDTSITKGQAVFKKKVASFLKFGVSGVDMMTRPFHKYQQERMQQYLDKTGSAIITAPTPQQISRQQGRSEGVLSASTGYMEDTDYMGLLKHLSEKPDIDPNDAMTIGGMLHQAKKVISTNQLTESQKIFSLQLIALEINKQKAKYVLIKRLIEGTFYQDTCGFKGFSIPALVKDQPMSAY